MYDDVCVNYSINSSELAHIFKIESHVVYDEIVECEMEIYSDLSFGSFVPSSVIARFIKKDGTYYSCKEIDKILDLKISSADLLLDYIKGDNYINHEVIDQFISENMDEEYSWQE